MSVALWIAVGLYALNLCVGVSAKAFGAKFGVWHHVLYALVFAAAVVAAIFAFDPWLLMTIAALVAIPSVSARSNWHPVIALVGGVGYVGAVLSQLR